MLSGAKEIKFIEDLEQLTESEKYQNTGFIHMISNSELNQPTVIRRRIHCNENKELCFMEE